MTASKGRGKAIGEVLAALGVIASLIFVGVEIRQNTKAVQGSTTNEIAQQSLDLTMAGLDNTELREVFRKATSDDISVLSREDRLLLGWFFAAKLRADENRFRQIKLGLVDGDNLGQLSNHRAYRFPYFGIYWEARRLEFSEDFRVFVDEEYLPLSLDVGAKVVPGLEVSNGHYAVECIARDDPIHVAVTTAREAFNAAIVEGQPEGIAAALADDVLLVTGTDSEVYRGRLDQVEIWAEDFKDPDRIVYVRTPNCVSASRLYPIAMESGIWRGAVPGDDANTLTGRYSAKWREDRGQWRLEVETFITVGCTGELCPEGEN